MALFLGLYLGHMLGDFALQPGQLVLAKRRGLAGMLLHVAIIGLATLLVLLDRMSAAWPAVLAAAIAHWAVEIMSVRARGGGGGRGLQIFLLDQALHVVSLAIIALIAAGGTPIAPVLIIWDVDLHWMCVAAGLTTASLFGGILVFECEGFAFRNDPGRTDNRILGLTGRRVYGMAERAGALLLGLTSGVALLGPAVFVPRLLWASRCDKDTRRGHLVEAGIGAALCLTMWVFIQVCDRLT
jgi:hypothetical protein